MVRDCFTHMTVIYCISHVQTLGMSFPCLEEYLQRGAGSRRKAVADSKKRDAAFGENGVQPQIAIY